jgi:glycosyltransferase involved in cell wall biosynthesis
MRVLQLHNLASSPGGAETVMYTDGRLLCSKGHDVERFVVKTEDIQEAGRVRSGIKATWNRDVAKRTTSAIRRFEPDIVHVYTPFPLASPAVFWAAAGQSAPVICTLQSYRYSCIKGILYRDGRLCELCKGRRLKLAGVRHTCYHGSLLASGAMTFSLVFHRQIGTFSKKVDLWLALSPFMRDRFVEEGIPADRVLVKPNTAPDLGYNGGPAGNYVVFAGRLEPEKGITTLLEAWRLTRSLPELRILGDGSLRSTVERAASSDHRITFLGWVSADEATKEISRSRFLVFPSEWYEGQPLAMVQALSLGTPAIASDVGNFSELIEDGVSGYLFRSGDPTSLASVVSAAIGASNDATAVRRMRRAARDRYLRGHTERSNISILTAAYDRVLRERQAGAHGGGESPG